MLKLPFFKDKENGEYNQGKTDEVIPFKLFFEVENGEEAKNDQGNHFLNGFQLCGVEGLVSDAVGWDLEAIFK